MPGPALGGRGASALFVFLSLLLFILSSLSPANVQGLRVNAADLLAPLTGAVNRPFQIAADYVQQVTGMAELSAENLRLKDENMRLREWYQTAMQLQAKNQSLEKLLNVAIEPQARFVTARVVADAGSNYVKTMLVLAGQDTGIDKGQAVISGEGLIGRTVEVGRRAARVLLVTDINSRVPVVIEGQDLRAIMSGRNNDMPALTVGSSRVDLQACKLEYSIVSPK